MALAAGARRALQASAARRLMPCAGLHTSSALGGKLSPEYPEHSVTKNNWVEKNEIIRENKFSTFEFTWGNGISLLFLLVLLPSGVYTVYHDEMKLRDTKCTNRETYKSMY